MKTRVGAILLLLVAAGAAWYWLNPRAHRAHSKVAECLPRDTILFLHLQDLRRTQRRFAKTAVAHILREPEVIRFLEKPKRELSWLKQLAEVRGQIEAIDAREAFLAVTNWKETGPEVIAGVEVRGAEDRLRQLLEQRRAQLHQKWPAGRSDLLRYREATVETYRYENNVEAAAQLGSWCFIANNLDALKLLIDRWSGSATDSGGRLRDDSLFQKSLAQVPRRYEAAVFARTGALTARLQALLSTLGVNTAPSVLEQAGKIEAITAATVIERSHFRDVLFVSKPIPQTPPPLSSKSLAFVTGNTIFYYASNGTITPGPGVGEGRTTGLPAAGGGLLKSFLANAGTVEQAIEAVGPGVGSVINWPAETSQPSFIACLDLRDRTKAVRLLESFTNRESGGATWSKQQFGPHTFYVGPPQGFALPVPVLVPADDLLLISFDLETARKAAALVDSKPAVGTPSSAFRTAAASVRRPTGAYAYIDTAALCDRAYGLVRSVLIIGSGFISKPGSSVEIAKLPATETLSKHLSPIAFSQSSDTAGIRFESVGPVTAVHLVVGAGAAAVSLGPLLPPGVSLSNFGNFLAPNEPQPATPAAPASPPPPAPGSGQGLDNPNQP